MCIYKYHGMRLCVYSWNTMKRSGERGCHGMKGRVFWKITMRNIY